MANFSRCAVLFVMLLAFAPMAQAQSTTEQKRKAYGSRVGDREQDVNNIGLSGDRRVSRRVDSRIDSRLNTRIDRFKTPSTDTQSAYTPKADDGTKKNP